jgi:hypothetical protein
MKINHGTLTAHARQSENNTNAKLVACTRSRTCRSSQQNLSTLAVTLTHQLYTHLTLQRHTDAARWIESCRLQRSPSVKVIMRPCQCASTRSTYLLLAKNSTLANQLNSPFLRLSAELRNRIYEVACPQSLVSLQTVTDEDFLELCFPRTIRSRSPFALVHTCRQIRHEPMSTFLKNTTFDLKNDTAFNTVLTDWDLRDTVRSIKITESVAALMSFSWKEKYPSWLASTASTCHLLSMCMYIWIPGEATAGRITSMMTFRRLPGLILC